MSQYSELQELASKLGMEKVVGVAKAELIAFIEEKGGRVTPEEPTQSVVEQETVEPVADEPAYEVATVFDGANEVRSYNVELHGENFIKLANEFAHSRGYRVEMGFLAGKIECPNCGKKFNL